jgi:hypothetical protein
VKTSVPRSTVTLSDGRTPACVKCYKRAKRKIMVNGRVKWLSYCQPCQNEYCRERRKGKTEMLVTPEERELVLAMRRPAKGRHHAA